MRGLIFIALAGFAAQLVDGGIGMGFGVTSTTILLGLAGLGAAQASAVVHVAELGTTAVSGFSHWRFGNVDWSVVARLGFPGAAAGFVGAMFLSNLPLDKAQPITAVVLVAIGANLVWRFSQGRTKRKLAKKAEYSTPFLGFLGAVGGLVDSTGGGGWGPVTTSTLLGVGRQQPRYIVGTVSASEFLVAAGASAGFVVGLWEEIVSHAAAVVALLIGGSIAAPIAAWLISRINPVALGGLVGSAIIALNIRYLLPLDTVWPVQLAIMAVGIALTVHGVHRYRTRMRVESLQRAAAASTESRAEPVAAESAARGPAGADPDATEQKIPARLHLR
ncbi:sulfite exporter TauE/SafE family protein [Corynebacterium propinquum]